MKDLKLTMAGMNSLSFDQRRVVVVDLDQTLIRGDTLHEQAIRIAFSSPLLLPGLIAALARGKAAVKSYCAKHVMLDPDVVNTCDHVLTWLAEEKAKGSYLVLCSAANRQVAEGIADHLGIFDEVIATTSGVNLKGGAKASALAERFPEGFIYAGDHPADLAVWEQSAGIVLVGTSPKTTRKAHALGKPIVAELRPRPRKAHQLAVWAKALRVHHWSKNMLMFVPLVLAHQWLNLDVLFNTGAGFALLLAVTSSSYLVNDLVDLDSDRRHATKRKRPLASGLIPVHHAVAFAGTVLPTALITGFLINPGFGLGLAAYLVITLLYSFRIKRIPLLDIFTIAILFTLRLIMGSAFLLATVPVWLVTFSMFFFFSLATAKRHAEILHAGKGGAASLASRGYRADDWPLTLALGVASGMASIVILLLYMVDAAFQRVGYARPEFLWILVLLIACWVGRIWLLTHRGEMHDDPVSFALTDRASQGLAVAMALCFLIAL